MRIDDILDHLRTEHGLDATAAWDEYEARVDDPTSRGFAEDLYERGLIDAATLGDLLTSDDVEVTRIVHRDFDVTTALGIETVITEEPSAADGPPVEATVSTDDPPGTAASGARVDADDLTETEAIRDADDLAETEAVRGADDLAETEAIPDAPGVAGDAASVAALRAGYHVLGLLGEGAMGEVHLARDESLRRQVAFKRTKETTARNRAALTRFFTEAQITSQLEHPHIVPVYGLEVGTDGSLAYAMKLVQGKELAELIAETRELYQRGEPIDEAHSLDERLEAFLKVCDAISFAHSKGVLHRDLKPSNIMIGRYHEVYVMDWGIARVMGDAGDAIDVDVELVAPDGSPSATDRTRAGASIGTPIYMSPEQAAGKNPELDGRSDLYTLGLILQEVVTLERALDGETVTEVMMKARTGERRPVRHFDSSESVPRELEAIIDKATRLDPDERYESVEAFADDIRRFLHGDAVKARPDTPLQKVGRWISKHRTATMGIIATALAIVLGAAATIGTLVYEQNQLTEAHARERQLSAFLTAVSTRSHRIDTEFQRYEAELENLVGGVQMVLAHADPSGLALYFPEDFSGGGNPPPDLVESDYYGMPISVAWPVSVPASGIDRADVLPAMRRLAWLRHELREVLVASFHLDYHVLSMDEQRRLLADDGAPVHRTFVSLAEGAHVSYPGMGGFPDDYDPRDRPYYTLAEGQKDEVWGDPYVDDYGRLVLACGRGLYDDQDRFRGVAGFEMTLRYIFDNLLDLPELDYVREELLVDREGVVMVEQVRDTPGGAGPGPQSVELETLPYPEVVEAIAEGGAGYVEIDDGDHLFVSYYPISAVGWSYVVVADAERMLAEGLEETLPASRRSP